MLLRGNLTTPSQGDFVEVHRHSTGSAADLTSRAEDEHAKKRVQQGPMPEVLHPDQVRVNSYGQQ